MRKDDDNLYTTLGVKTTASAKEIKLAYYKLAKKYHPDFNQEGDSAKAGEMFKKVHKAYEVLSNPISRQAYDIENRINEGGAMNEQTMYTDATSNRTYYQPRTQTDFYHTKWTGYQKPKWFHPYNGYDVRSEYIYRKKLHDRFWYIPPWVDIVLERIEMNRLIIYIVAFFLGDAIRLFFSLKQQRAEKLELELLKQSFELEDSPANPMSLMNLVTNIDAQAGDDEDIVFDASSRAYGEGTQGEERKEMIKKALNEYINERLSAVSQEYNKSAQGAEE